MAPLDALLFIDTNILLDFYRVRGMPGGLELLNRVDEHHDRIITSSQVEMEYKKNRQRVILESLKNFRTPEWGGLSTPVFLAQAKPTRAMETARKQIDKQQGLTRRRIEAVLRNPGSYDPVYQVAMRLFRNESPLNLNRSNDIRYRIRRLAWKRFILGYPPRKSSDTSTGDAINWEWMISCAEAYSKDLVIVSRDSDYGHSYQGFPILNDWLAQEFKDRVGRRRRIVLTDKLSEAFGHIAVRVTKKEEDAEQQLLESVKAVHSDPAMMEFFGSLMSRLSERDAKLFGHFLGLQDKRVHPLAEIEEQFGLPPGGAKAELQRIAQLLRPQVASPAS